MDNLPVKDATVVLPILILSLLLILFWPLAVIWSLNTLFDTGIPYSLRTWAATVVLVTIVRVSTLSPEKR
jgi:hypothetical protein